MLELFHPVNPYENFDHEKYDLIENNLSGNNPVFEKVILKTKPKLIIEVGTWLGGSAFYMLELCKKHNLDTKIICVDTWLGGLEFRTWPELYEQMMFVNGYPNVYYQFIANVIKKGYQESIIPFPITSTIAANFFKHHKIQADLIYIDGSHDVQDVFQDLNSYWDIVKDGGILFGDDADWPGVLTAINHYKPNQRIILNKKFIYTK